MNGATIFASEANSRLHCPIAFEHRASIDQALGGFTASGLGADELIQLVEQRTDDLVIVVAPGVGSDDATAGIVENGRRQVELVVVDGEHDERVAGGEWRVVCQKQLWLAAFFAVIFEIVHFTGTPGGDPFLEEIGVGRFANGQDAAMIKAKTSSFVFDAGGESGLRMGHIGFREWEISPENPKLTCGKCTRCLDACPTHAFVGPYHLDPQRCISYWTIEAQSVIPRDLRPRFGNRIFGCDICQEVCPWNKRLPERSPLLAGLLAQKSRIAPPLLEGFANATPYWLEQAAFAERFRRSPIKRAKRQGMLRNVCIALGNWGDPVVIPALQKALVDPSPVVRVHAAWALGELLRKHQSPQIRPLLEAQLENEDDEVVRLEIGWVLTGGE